MATNRAVGFRSLLRIWVIPVVLVASINFPLHLRAQTHAQNPPAGSGNLIEIRASGSKLFSSDQIAAASGLHLGQAVQREDFKAASDRLAALGYFSEVLYRFASKGKDVSVEFQVKDAPIAAVAFDNFPWFSDDELAEALRDAGFLFNEYAPQQGSALDEMAQTLQKLLESRGVHAVVEHTLLASPETEDEIQQFRVVGPSLLVGSVRYTDALAANDLHIQDRLADLVGKPYSRYAVELFTLEQVRPIYLSHGLLGVIFGKPTVQLAGDPTKPLPDKINVVVPVEPGPVYKLGGFTWSGHHIFAVSELDDLVGMHLGDLADGLKLMAAWERLRNAYGKRGFLDAQVSPELKLDAQSTTAAYNVIIAEGPQYHMGELVLTGLSLEGERRIRAAWGVGKGAVFDKEIYDDFIAKGAKLAFGDLPFHYEQIGTYLRKDPKTATVDVLLDFH